MVRVEFRKTDTITFVEAQNGRYYGSIRGFSRESTVPTTCTFGYHSEQNE
jgi:hypothetical protein